MIFRLYEKSCFFEERSTSSLKIKSIEKQLHCKRSINFMAFFRKTIPQDIFK